MLPIVDDEQLVPIAEVVLQRAQERLTPAFADLQRASDRMDHEVGLTQLRKVDERQTISVGVLQVGGDR